MKYILKKVFYLLMVLSVSQANGGAYEDLFRAINIDDAAAVRSLLERGIDPNSVDERGHQALYLALREGSTQVAAVLMAHPGLRVDATNAAGETALMMAALRGNLESAKRLVERGSAVNREGWAPLHYAASGPSAAMVRFLLDRGAAIDAPSPNGSTALMLAARYGSEESVKVLLERGADARLKNARDLDAAAFARLGGREALAERLAQRAR